jgi:hypothetical protein
VVEVGATALIVEDTTAVELELEGVGLNGDGDGAGCEGGLELSGAILRNKGLSGVLNDSLGRVEGAVSVLGSVRVVALKLHSVLSDVVHGGAHISTVAALVAVLIVAVNQLLLGEAEQLVSRDE